MDESMMALRAHTRGGPEVLHYEQAPLPRLEAGDVLVAVHAAAITFTELGWDKTWTRDGKDRTPIIPSHEMSGVVAAIGDRADGFLVGDEVYGLVPFDRDGAAAAYVAVPTDSIAAKPRTVPHSTAAAVPVAALTAWQALVDHGRLRSGDRVLVHGGAGGVGAFVTQIGAALGADVTATALAADRQHVVDLGARRVIDFQRERFDEQPGVFDIVIDTVGGETLDRSFPVLRPGGRLVTLQAPPSQEKAEHYGIEAIFFVVSPSRGELARLVELVDRHELSVTLAGTYPLEQGQAAYLSGQSLSRKPGKTVLIVQQ